MISQRLRGLSEDGEAVDGLLPKLEKQFASVGISIQDQNGDLRSSFDILQDLAGVWDQLSSKQKQYFGEKVAGNRQVKTLNAIMQNWDVVADTIDKANNAQGAAIEGNEMYMDSIAGKITQLKSAWQELATTTINSGFIKGFVDIGTAVVKLTTNIGGLAPVLTTVLGLFVAIKGANIAEAFKAIGSAIISAISGIGSAATVMSGWIGIAIAVAGAIYSIVNAISKMNDTTRKLEKAKENYKSQQSAVQDLNSELENTKNRIKELEGKELTIVEQNELDKLKDTNKELEAQIKLEEKLLEIADREQRNAAVKDVKKYQSSDAKSGAIKPSEYMNRVSTEDLLEIAGYDYSSMTSTQRSDALSSINFTNDMMADLNVKALVAAREEYEKAYKDYLKLSEDADEEIISQSKQNITDLEEEIQKYENELYSYYNTLSGKVEGISESEDNPEFTAIKNRMKEIGDYLSDDVEVSIEDQVNTILSKYDGATNVIKEKVQELGDAFTLDSLKDTVNELGEDIEFDALVNEIATKLNLTHDEVEQLFKETFSFDSASVTPSFNIGLDEITLFSTTESYKNLTAAMTEQQKAGKLSFETMKTLMGDEGLKGISEYLYNTADGYALNTEGIYDFIKAQQQEQKLKAVAAIMERTLRVEELQKELANLTEEEIAAGREAEIIGEIAGINDEIIQFETLRSEVDNATNALERYRAATKTANQDSEHTEGTGAYKTVQEGYKSGKIGTDDFKEGMSFLLGDDWIGKFEGNVEKAYKEASRIGERYFGSDDSTSAANFAEDLGNLQINGQNVAEYDKVTGQLQMLTDESGNVVFSMEEIADAMGISESAAASLFGLLNSYSLEDQITFEKPITSAEELAVAEKKLNEIDEQRKQLQEEINQAEESGDTAGIEEKQAALEELNGKYDNLSTAIDTAKEAMESGDFEPPLSLDEALDKIAELQTAIDTLNANGITVPVKLSDAYNDLVNFVSGTDSNGGYNIAVNDIGDAQERLAEIEKVREAIDKNPNIDTSVKAQIEGNLDEQEEALNTYISQAQQLKSQFGEGGDYSATITCDATDNASPKIQFVNQELFGENGQMGIDGRIATANLEANDNGASENANAVTESIDKIPDDHTTEVDANVNEESIVQAEEDIETGINPDDVVFNVDYNKDSYRVTKKDLDDLAAPRTITYTINTKNRSIEFGEGTTPEDVVNGSTNVLSKGASGSYTAGNVATWLYDYVKNGGAPYIDDAKAEFKKQMESGEIVADELAIKQLDVEQSTLTDLYNGALNEEGMELDLNGETDLDPIEAPVKVDKDEIQDEVEDAADSANPEVDVDANTDDYVEEIDENTPEEEVSVSPGELDSYTEGIHDATPDEETVNIQENVTLNPPDPSSGGGKSVSYNATMSVSSDMSEANSNIASSQAKASEGQTFDVDANTKPADAKIDKTQRDARKSQSFTTTVNVNRSKLDDLYKDLAVDKTQKVTVEYEEKNKPSELAVGTKNAKGGLSLVDEQGAELIEHVSNGTFELGTNNGPRFTNLEKGDVVHTASETKKILSRLGNIGGFFRDGLNKAKSIIGNAFAYGSPKGSVNLSSLRRVIKSAKSGSSGKRNSGRSGGTSSEVDGFKDWAENLFDWAEIRLDRLKTQTNAVLLDVANTIGYVKKNMKLNTAINKVKKEVRATTKAYDLYLKQADKVAKKGELSKDIVRRIQDGSISISSYSKDVQERIKEYQEWYDKAMNCVDALKDLKEQQKELAAQKLENIVDAYSSIIDRIESRIDKSEALRERKTVRGQEITEKDYSTEIEREEKVRKNQKKERDKLQKQLRKEIKRGNVKKGDDTWKKYQKAIYDLDTSIIQTDIRIEKLKDDANELIATKLEYKLDAIKESANKTRSDLELAEAKGSISISGTEQYYNESIKEAEEENKLLRDQREYYRSLQKGLDVNSEEYQEFEKKINSVNAAIRENKLNIQSWKDAIDKLPFDKASYKMGELTDAAAALNDALSLKNATGRELFASDYQASIENNNHQIAILEGEKKGYENLMAAMVKEHGEAAKGSKKYLDYAAAARSLDSQIRGLTLDNIELGKAIRNLPVQKLGWASDALESNSDSAKGNLELAEARGSKSIRSTYGYYSVMSDSLRLDNDILEAQNKIYRETQKDYDRNSEEFQSLEQAIRDNNSQINSNNLAIEEYKDKINMLPIKELEYGFDELKDEAERFNDVISYDLVKGVEINSDAYDVLIKNGNNQIINLNKQKKRYEDLMKAMVATYGEEAKKSEKYLEYAAKVREYDDSIRDLTVSTIEYRQEQDKLEIQKLGWQFDAVAESAKRMQDLMDLHEAQGIEETSHSYADLIKNGNNQIKILEKQIAKYEVMQHGLDEYSERYQDLQSKINSSYEEIASIKVLQEQWNDSIIDIGINSVQKYRDALSKTNEEYKRQKDLQEAIQDLEKATYQKKVRTYVEGEGFVYQASADALKNAQEKLEDVITDQLLGKLDDLIEALEESKDNQNVYDANGNLIGTKYTVPNLGSINKVLSDYRNNNLANLDMDVLKDAFGNDFASSIGDTTNNSPSLSIGDIIVNEAEDGNDLAKAIIEQFPNALLQALYKK